MRGIHAVNSSVVWASGSGGTVLRSQDGGAHWQKCAVPPDGDKLDFRAVWAWDANSAVVMSAGPGEASRIYRTTDGCQQWTEERRNTDKDGFWDALVFPAGDAKSGMLLGDPIGGHFYIEMMTRDGKWRQSEDACAALAGAAAFAAGNTSVYLFSPGKYIIATGGKPGAQVLLSPALAKNAKQCQAVAVPLAGGNESSGAFSVMFRDARHGVVVGGDYQQPNKAEGTAAYTSDGGRHWTAATHPPHGYRSAVAWDSKAKVWVAAGTNGSDVSRDDGKTWQSLDDGDWNALSLPFAVGPKGRIGKLTMPH